MKVTEAVQQRRSVKWFDPEHRMPEATFQRLMQHALLSPTAFNIQNWRFVVVSDTALRQRIREAAWDQAQVIDASELRYYWRMFAARASTAKTSGNISAAVALFDMTPVRV